MRNRDGLLNRDFKTPLGKVSYHIPCHLRVQNMGQKTRELFELGHAATGLFLDDDGRDFVMPQDL